MSGAFYGDLNPHDLTTKAITRKFLLPYTIARQVLDNTIPAWRVFCSRKANIYELLRQCRNSSS
jgi:hypothetical protein